jgi:60 kDa SS-A/Ro ribonucleoprotein
MNLNTLVRHEVFNASDGAELAKYVVGRLVDADDIRRSRQFPYQFLAAYLNAGDTVPHAIKAGPSDRARDLLWHT